MRRPFAALWLAAILSCPFAVRGQQGATAAGPGDFVTLSVSGPLDERKKAILEQLIEPTATPKLIETVAKKGAPLASVCGRSEQGRCSNLGAAVTAANWDAGSSAIASDVKTRKIEGIGREFPTAWGRPFGTDDNTFLVFSAHDPVVRAARGGGGEQPIVVPESALDAAGISLAGPHGSGEEAVAVIESDLRLAPASERNFRINRRLPEAKVRELLVALNTMDGDTLSATRRRLPQSSFSLIQFQNAATSCTATPPNWPFDAARVKEIMQFNAQVRQRLRLGPLQRARILVVDTGLGKGLAQSERFGKLLYADAAELMAPPSVQRDFNEPWCTDANGNDYWHDVYGTGSGVAVSDDARCLSPDITAFDLIDPFPRQPTSQQLYNPDHGSFVAGLAAGGPQLLSLFPEISDYVGLSIFRVTQKSDMPELSIINEFADITKSLNYATTIRADVINVSLKTNRGEPFKVILDNPNALLVAAAGNGEEDLDGRPAENFPASMSMPDRMIVVAALQPDADHPLWPSSAYSPSRVHIAAPGANIASFNAQGGDICDSGTSAAAPLVSFVAGALKALTGALRPTIRARILAAADHDEKLMPSIEEGRRLNVEAALDLFVDRIELKDGSPHLLRGWIEPDRGDPLVAVCKPAGGSFDPLRGKIDLALLWEWYRQPSGRVSLRYNRSASEIFAPGSCDAPDGTFKFFDLATRSRRDIGWEQVQKVLPTPFRSAKSVILN